MWIAQASFRLILRHRDDAIADRLHLATGLDETHATLADERLGYGRCLGHFGPPRRLQLGEPVCGLTDLLVRELLRDRIHSRSVLSRATLEVGHLADDVIGRKAGHARGFWMTFPGHQMTRAARERAGVPFLNNRRGWRMLVRKPVWRIQQVVNLCGCVALRAAWQILWAGIFGRDRAIDG